MHGLNSHRYVAALLKRSLLRAFLVDPCSYSILAGEIKALNSQPGSALDTTDVNVKDLFYKACQTDSSPGPDVRGWKDFTEALENLSFLSVSPAETLDADIYKKSIQDTKFGVTELFDPQWKTMNIGAARNVLLKNVQIKGVGRILPTNNLHHLYNTGRMTFVEATHSFIMSHIGNIMLPLGTMIAHGVLIDPDSEEALYIRAADGIRIAQIPENPSVEELSQLRKSCKTLHPGSTPEGIVRRSLAQYASQFFLGLSNGASPDNFLIDGRAIDEEGWDFRTEQGQLSFSIDMYHPDRNTYKTTDSILDYPWSEVTKFRTSVASLSTSIFHLMKGLRIIYPSLSLTDQDARDYFLEYLCALNREHHTVEESKLREIFKRFYDLDGKNGTQVKDLIKFLLELGFTGTILPFRFNERSQLRLFSPGGVSRQGEVGVYENTLHLNQLHHEGLLAGNSLKFTNDLLKKIALKATPLNVLPDIDGYPVTNTSPFEEWWALERQRLQKLGTVRLFHYRTRDGEMRSTDHPGTLKGALELEPLYLEVIMRDENLLNIPCRKIYLSTK